MKNLVKWFLIVWFSVAFLCQCFGQCDYEVNSGDTVLTEYQTVYMDSARSVHLSLIQVGGSVALEVSLVSRHVEAPRAICLDEWATLSLILSNGPTVVAPFIGHDTCASVFNQNNGTYKQYVTGLYELDEIQLALLERHQVDSLIMYFATSITGLPLQEKIKRRSKGRPIYGKRKFNGKQYFTNQIPCLTWLKTTLKSNTSNQRKKN